MFSVRISQRTSLGHPKESYRECIGDAKRGKQRGSSISVREPRRENVVFGAEKHGNEWGPCISAREAHRVLVNPSRLNRHPV